MFDRTIACLFALSLTATASTAWALDVELQNDGFMDNGQATCHGGFAIGDEGAATFTHDIDYQIKSVRFLFCGADTTQTLTVRVYGEEGTAEPGILRYEADYEVTGAIDAYSEIDLSNEGLTFSGGESFRFSVLFQHTGTPGLASDVDGISAAGVNWVFDTLTGAWDDATAFNVDGDWIVRATIETEGAGGGGGAGPATTVSTGGAGGSGGAGGAGAVDEGGDDCSCRQVGGHEAPMLSLLLTVAGAAAYRARRRRC